MGGNIFNGNINGRATAWMMIGMLVFAVAWEGFTNYLERRFEHNKAHSEILNKVYRELMILGVIAFGLIMGKEVGWVDWNPETLQCFEFCDLLVSISVLVYVANCAISSFTLHTVERDWDRVSLMPTARVLKDTEKYLSDLEGSMWLKFKGALPFFGRAWRKDSDFKVMQLLFQMKFHMPPQFDYVMYLKLVLQDVVTNMANITSWHWLILMLINFVWWVGMVYVLPAFSFPEAPESPTICIAFCDTESRRRLAAAAAPKVCRAQLFEDTCSWDDAALDGALQKLRSNLSDTSYRSQCNECLESLRAGPDDIEAAETLRSVIIYVAVGWSLVAGQGLIVSSLYRRIEKIMTICDGNQERLTKEEIPGLLKSLQAEVNKVAETHADMAAGDPSTERTDVRTKKDLHHMYLVNVDGDGEDEEADTIMVFSEVGMTANDIFSIAKYETFMFLTQMVQLITDFYFGFYLVHVIQRVPKAFGHDTMMDADLLAIQYQLLFHAAIIGSVAGVVLLVILTTRKITILLGVLHLAEDPMSDVLKHVETVISLRTRIKDRLRSTALTKSRSDPDEAQRVLDKLSIGEKALLEQIDGKDWTDRMTRNEIYALFEAHQENLTFKRKLLDKFLSREAFEAYNLLAPQDQSTIMTAHTLQMADAEGDDTVEVADFAGWVVRRAAEKMLRCMELSPREGAVQKLRQQLEKLNIVDNRMIERGMMVGRARTLFEMADADGGGTISRPEMQKMLRRFKVPISKKEFEVIWRVIDPDQSRTLEMDEWLHFMLAEDTQLEQATKSQVTASQKENAQKGGMTTLFQEGTQLFLGETAGKVVGSGLAAGNVDQKSNANRDVDFDEMEDEVENPAAAQVPHS